MEKQFIETNLDRPRIRVDFNEQVDHDLVLRSKEDYKVNSARETITFHEGMEIGIYEEDWEGHSDKDGNFVEDVPDFLIADGMAIRTPDDWQKEYPECKWCCKLTGTIKHISDLSANNQKIS
ncbi:MAG: hypothetical protein LBU53_11895 [Zoogloeaceae bacterium]|jgi:hypothetical protein|nr:hypothetical protein [Zoogloeaceae bacterium]